MEANNDKKFKWALLEFSKIKCSNLFIFKMFLSRWTKDSLKFLNAF